MHPHHVSLGGQRYPLAPGLAAAGRRAHAQRRVLIVIELSRQGLDVRKHLTRIRRLCRQLLTHHRVQLVEYIAAAPRRTPAHDELVEEHAVQEAGHEGRVGAEVAQAEEGRLVEGDVGLGMDPDHGEAGA
ncbi:MAG: hypothetical protein ACK56I_01895, partial [bacterium]